MVLWYKHTTPCLSNIDCQGTTRTWSTFDTLSLFRTLYCQLRAPPDILCGKRRLELRPPTPNSFQAICTTCVVHADLQVCPTLHLPRLFNVFLGFPTFVFLSSLVYRSWYTKQTKQTNKQKEITQILFTLNFARVRDCTWHVQQAF